MSFKVKKFKYHAYFLNNVVIRRPYLTEEKIEEVLKNYIEKKVQENGRIVFVGYDNEAKKYLQIIVESEKPELLIFNAYYNRNYKLKK